MLFVHHIVLPSCDAASQTVLYVAATAAANNNQPKKSGRVVVDGAEEHRRFQRQRVHLRLAGAVVRTPSHRGGG